MRVGMRLALGVASKLSLLEAVTDSESLSCKATDQKCLSPQSSGRLALRQRALLKLSYIISARLTITRKQLNKKGA
jgi:hypothetical protein